jgi:valyl-tRNA synthetase
MKIGRRLAIKLLNASKFVLARTAPSGPVTEPIDRGMLARLSALVGDTTRHLEAYDYAAALRETEEFFWWFCDDYIELVKRRRSGEASDAQSAIRASAVALDTILRLFAPFLPFVTEEVWSWWQRGSVHRAGWPDRAVIDAEAPASDLDRAALRLASEVTGILRQERSSQKLGFGVPVRARIDLPGDAAPAWAAAERDVLAGNNVTAADVNFGAAAMAVGITPQTGDA